MCQILRVYGVGGKLLKAVQSFYEDSRACVRVGNDVSEWFPVDVGLRQGCVMSPWLFNVYMDGVVREVNLRVLGKRSEMVDPIDWSHPPPYTGQYPLSSTYCTVQCGLQITRLTTLTEMRTCDLRNVRPTHCLCGHSGYKWYYLSIVSINFLLSRADRRVLRWFGNVERMDEYRMARKVLMAEVSGGRVLGRPRLGWMDGVKVALGNRGMTVEAARQCAKDWKVWRALVHT